MTVAADLLSGAALGAFRLNGQFLGVAEELARPASLTASSWQVLGAVLTEPAPVAGIARQMGLTRQSVQRTADLLVERGWARYQPNPAHRRAKLLAATEAGLAAVGRITPGHAAFAARLVEEFGEAELRRAVDSMHRLSAAIDTVVADPQPSGAV